MIINIPVMVGLEIMMVDEILTMMIYHLCIDIRMEIHIDMDDGIDPMCMEVSVHVLGIIVSQYLDLIVFSITRMPSRSQTQIIVIYKRMMNMTTDHFQSWIIDPLGLESNIIETKHTRSWPKLCLCNIIMMYHRTWSDFVKHLSYKIIEIRRHLLACGFGLRIDIDADIICIYSECSRVNHIGEKKYSLTLYLMDLWTGDKIDMVIAITIDNISGLFGLFIHKLVSDSVVISS